MKLPGWTFMVVGAIVIAYTKFVEAKGDSHLRFFFWIGIAFLAYGFFKELANRIVKPKPRQAPATPPLKQDAPPPRQQAQSPHATHQHTRPQQHPSHPYPLAGRTCPRCQASNVGHANFCHGCGQRL